jgi:thymidylate synthase (FAD)
VDKFRIELLAATPNPQQLIWAAMHQDYSEDCVCDQQADFPTEEKAGALIIKHLLAGNKGHFGPLEHPQITVNVCAFPHSMMQQVRTHRVGVSFDVQCLAGDTEITFLHAGGSLRKIKISELYDLWENGEKAIRERKIKGRHGEPPGIYRRDCKKRLRNMKLRVLNEDTQIFEIGHLREVMARGTQPVYRLTLDDGKIIDCTKKHRFLTTDGWQTMEAATGLLTNAQHEVTSRTKNCEVMCNGAIAQNIKPVSTNDLQTSWSLESAELVRLTCHPVKITNVEYLGLQETYDLEVEDPWHNFVANGIVVHNSNRYTGQRVLDVVQGKRSLEDVFYLRPVGNYTNRQGKKYFYSEDQRNADLEWCFAACQRYADQLEAGMSEEHARGTIPFDVRQHFVLSCNVRSLMHLLDLRWKKDAQLEAQQFAELLFKQFEQWCPAIAQWYLENRAKKAKLSP